MYRFRHFALVIVAVLLALTAANAQDAKKKKANLVQGSLTKVETSQTPGEGTLIVSAMDKKSGTTKEVKILVKADTKIEKMVGKKKDNMADPAIFTDLQEGKQVSITLRKGTSDQAERVLLTKAKKKNQAN